MCNRIKFESMEKIMALWGLSLVVSVALKVGGVVSWGWVWVLAPLWIGVALGVGMIALYLVVAYRHFVMAERRKSNYFKESRR